jgi:hypothetical protein
MHSPSLNYVLRLLRCNLENLAWFTYDFSGQSTAENHVQTEAQGALTWILEKR